MRVLDLVPNVSYQQVEALCGLSLKVTTSNSKAESLRAF